jgi:hypothetical protein
MRRTLFLLFLVHLLTRLLFVNLAGVNNNYRFQCDSFWLVKMADDATIGNFNFDIGRFIASPLYPVACGFFKITSPFHWEFYLGLFQIIISAISGLYLFKICHLLFRSKELAILASLIYAFFPLTMWYVNTFSQETLFQSLFIIMIYHLLKSLKTGNIHDVIRASIFFSLAYLTKSHILLFAIFIPLIYFHAFRFSTKTIYFVTVFAFIAILFSVPYGLYQYTKNGTYVLSSNGAGYQFYLGNTEAGYKTIVDVPEKDSREFRDMENIALNAGEFNGNAIKYAALIHGSQDIKQGIFFRDGLKWIKDNPVKFLKLKIYDTFLFLIPGVSFRHYDFSLWLLSFCLSLPLYLFAYRSIFIQNKNDFKMHSWMIYLFLSMLIFSTFWYVQNRFRTITLEPFYIIYASYYLNKILLLSDSGKKITRFLEYMFVEYPRSVEIKKKFKQLLRAL